MKLTLNLASKPSPSHIFSLLSLALLLAIGGSSLSGAIPIPWQDLPHLLFGSSQSSDQLAYNVLVDIRLPRVLFSCLNGAALAIAGVTIQALFRNPLAEPGLVGISSGAALGAVIAIVLSSGGFFITSSAAFAGGLGATFLAYHLGRRFQGISGLLLAGIAINTVAGSAIGLLTTLANDNQLRDLTFWSMGSLAGGTWTTLSLLTPIVVLLTFYLCKQWRLMNALLLGEREASHLGFHLATVRKRLILATALLVGPLVATTGGIGFVGLVVPHLMRMLLGANHRYLLPASALAGALLLSLADLGARVLIAPAELPIGLVTSLIGGPFFFWMLTRVRTTHS